MLEKLFNTLKKKETKGLESLIKEFQLKPELLKELDLFYGERVKLVKDKNKNTPKQNAEEFIQSAKKFTYVESNLDILINQIVDELVSQTRKWSTEKEVELLPSYDIVVSPEDIKELPKELQPQLLGNYLIKDIAEPSSIMVFEMYKRFLKTNNFQDYAMFANGIDFLDLDPIIYKMLDSDTNAMGNWLPKIYQNVINHTNLKIPKTEIIKVPITLLQTTRMYEYTELSPITIEVINRYAQRVFNLEDKDYFIKTGTFSSKFDFRNARVTKGKELSEIGSYLWFITHQAVAMCSPLSSNRTFGISPNNEWVVREYIETENEPTIYNGLPLRTEFRFFVDFDKKEILGVSPYWREDVMNNHFSKLSKDEYTALNQQRDFIAFNTALPKLNKEYNDNVRYLGSEIQKLVNSDTEMKGQWSVDVMKNGEDYYLIDMALASWSALNDVVPKEKLNNSLDTDIIKKEFNWLIGLKDSNKQEREIMIKYPSLTNHYNIVKTRKFEKVLDLPFYATEKIHGSNMSIELDKGENFKYFSRNKEVTLIDGHLGQFLEQTPTLPLIKEVMGEVLKTQFLFNTKHGFIKSTPDKVIVYGELYGAGIQDMEYQENVDKVKNYKVFEAFVFFGDVGMSLSLKELKAYFKDILVPIFYEGKTLRELISMDLPTESKLGGSIEGLVYKQVSGIDFIFNKDSGAIENYTVVKHKRPEFYEKRPNSSAPKGSKEFSVGEMNFQNNLQVYFTKNRLQNVLSKGIVLDVRNMREIISTFLEDVKKDYLEDSVDAYFNEKILNKQSHLVVKLVKAELGIN